MCAFDRFANSIVLVTDPLGLGQFLYARADDGSWVFATQPHELIALLGAKPAYNMPRILEVLNGGWYRPGDTTPFRGVQAVQPGHVVTIGRGQLTARAFYSPFELLTSGGPGTQPEDLAATLVAATRSVTRRESSIDISLSGGLDSSSVAWAATQVNSDVTATHMLMTRADPGGEWGYAQRVARHLGIPLAEHDVRETMSLFLSPLEAPYPLYPSRTSLFLAHVPGGRSGITLTGEGGDAVFHLWAYPWHVHDHLFAGEWNRAREQAWRFCYSNGTPLVALLRDIWGAERRRLRRRPPSHPRKRGVYQSPNPQWISAWPDEAEHSFVWDLPRTLGAGRSSHIYTVWANALRYSNDVLPTKGQRFCIPFALPVVELMLRTPIHQLADVYGNDRPLLRKALAPHLPREVVLAEISRAISGVPDSFNPVLDILMLELSFEAWEQKDYPSVVGAN